MKSVPLYCCLTVLTAFAFGFALETSAEQKPGGTLIKPFPAGQKAPAPKRLEAKSQTVAWQTSWSAAQATSQKTGKPIFVYFHASWCGPCRAMEKTTWQDTHVIRASRAWVPFKADLDSQSDLAARFEVGSPPTVVFLGGKNQKISSLVGNNDALTLTKALQLAVSAKRN